MRTKHRTNFRSLFASTESAGLPPIEGEEPVVTEASVAETTDAVETTEVAPVDATPVEGADVEAPVTEVTDVVEPTVTAEEPAVTEATDTAPVTEPVEGEGVTDTEVELELTPEEADAEIAETNAAEDETDVVVAEAESEIDAVHEVAEVNEEFVQEAQKAAEEGDFEQVTATIEASNEALRILTGTEKYDIKSISFENYSNERVRATMLRVSLEAMEERTGNILQRAWEAIKKMIRAAMDFIEDLVNRFRNQEKRLEKLKGELKGLNGKQRIAIKSKSLAARLSGSSIGVDGVGGLGPSMLGLEVGLEDTKRRLAKLQDFYKNIFTEKFDRSYDALISALELNPFYKGGHPKQTVSFMGGFDFTVGVKDQPRKGSETERDIKIIYEFSHNPPKDVNEEIVLPTASDMVGIIDEVLSAYKKVKTSSDEIKRDMKQTEGAFGAVVNGFKSARKEGDSADKRKARISRALEVQGIFYRAFNRPVMDFMKMAAFHLQTTAMLATAVVRSQRGESADETEASTESFNGTVADGTVDKLRSESPEDDTQVASDSGVKKDEEITPAADDEVNEHKEEATVAPKKMTTEEFEDTNAAEVAESLEDITAALEDLEQREGALDDTIQAIEILEDAEGEGGLNSAGAALLNLSAESVNRLMGFKDMPHVTASVESYQTVSGRRMANAASMESLKERANAIIEKLKQALKMILDWIKHVASRFYEMVVAAEKRADAILAKLKTMKQSPEGEITNAQVLKMISSRQGSVDAASIGRSLERAKSLLEISETLGDGLLARAMASADDLNQRVNFGAECAKIARAEFTKAGVAFNPKDAPVGELFGLLGGQQLNVTVDDKVGLVNVTLSDDDAVKPPASVKYFSVQDSVKIVEDAKSVLATARQNKAITEKALGQLDRFMKSNPKIDESKDQNGGVFRQWSSDVQKNSRGVTQLIAQSFKGVKFSVDAALRIASYTAGAKEKEEPAQATAPAAA